MKTKTKKTNAVPPTAVTDLADIESYCSQPVEVKCVVRGRAFHFTGRRLLPREAREIKLILESAVPPVIQEEGKPARYDMENEGYRKAKEGAWRLARSLAIWMTFPCFQEKAASEAKARAGAGAEAKLPGTATEVMAWMESRKLEDDILEGLFEAVTKEEVNSYLGFTFGSSSPTP